MKSSSTSCWPKPKTKQKINNRLPFLRGGGTKKTYMETVITKQQDTQTMRQKLYDLLVAISWADLSRTYFGKSSSWLYHKLDSGNFFVQLLKPTSFTPEETEKLKGALVDLSERIRRAADSI